MNIGIDIDDTIMETFDYLMPYVSEYFGVEMQYLKKNNISYSNLLEEWKTKEIDFCRKYYDKVVPNTPIKNDAKKYIKKIKELGHTIFIITARDNRLYTNAYKTTYDQLKTNNIYFDELICAFDKKQVCIEKNINIFIDDSISNCEKVKSLGIETILFNSKSNINLNVDLIRFDSWKKIYKFIKCKYRKEINLS